MAPRDTPGTGFLPWALAGFLLAFGVAAIPSIGAPFLLAGIVLICVIGRRGPRWPVTLGALAGVGAVGVVIGLIGAVGHTAAWLVSGTSLTALAVATYWGLRRGPGPLRSEQ